MKTINKQTVKHIHNLCKAVLKTADFAPLYDFLYSFESKDLDLVIALKDLYLDNPQPKPELVVRLFDYKMTKESFWTNLDTSYDANA